MIFSLDLNNFMGAAEPELPDDSVANWRSLDITLTRRSILSMLLTFVKIFMSSNVNYYWWKSSKFNRHKFKNFYFSSWFSCSIGTTPDEVSEDGNTCWQAIQN